MSTRSNLYKAARLLGDVQAASKGPGAYAKRKARSTAYRKTNSDLGKLLRALGLTTRR